MCVWWGGRERERELRERTLSLRPFLQAVTRRDPRRLVRERERASAPDTPPATRGGAGGGPWRDQGVPGAPLRPGESLSSPHLKRARRDEVEACRPPTTSTPRSSDGPAALLEHPDVLREVLLRLARRGCTADLCRLEGVCRAFRAELSRSPQVWRESYRAAFKGSRVPGLAPEALETEWEGIARRGVGFPTGDPQRWWHVECGSLNSTGPSQDVIPWSILENMQRKMVAMKDALMEAGDLNGAAGQALRRDLETAIRSVGDARAKKGAGCGEGTREVSREDMEGWCRQLERGHACEGWRSVVQCLRFDRESAGVKLSSHLHPATLHARRKSETERAESKFWKECIRKACASDPVERLALQHRLSHSVDGTRRTCKAWDRVRGRPVFLKQSDMGEGADSYFLREVSGLKALQDHSGAVTLRRVYSLRHPVTVPQPGALPASVTVHCVELEWIPCTLTDCIRHTNARWVEMDQGNRDVEPSARSTPSDPISRDIWKEHYFLDSETVKLYAHQLVKAVAQMHQHGFLHRDLTPYAIRVCEDQKSVRLAGLKFSRMATVERGNLTAEVVTLWYRPPEVLLGVDLYSTELDMWSLGCTLYEMSTGKAAFPGGSELETLFLIFQKVGSPPPGSFLAKLPYSTGQFPKFKPTLRDPLQAKGGIDSLGRRNARKKTPTPGRQLGEILGEAGMDLLERLLNPDPQERISAKEALAHPYFAN